MPIKNVCQLLTRTLRNMPLLNKIIMNLHRYSNQKLHISTVKEKIEQTKNVRFQQFQTRKIQFYFNSD